MAEKWDKSLDVKPFALSDEKWLRCRLGDDKFCDLNQE